MLERSPGFLILVAAASVVARCSDSETSSSPTPALQLRLVTSSSEGPCSEPPLTSDAPGTTCGMAGVTTYEVGRLLGEVTPTTATLTDSQGSGPGIAIELDETNAATLGEVTGEAIDEQLALLLEGRVISAPRVAEPITTGQLVLAMPIPAEAEQVVATLGAPATS